jgi:LCP family protein required for cell wall assembly
MSDLDLDLLREWSPAPPPSAEVRADALEHLRQQIVAGVRAKPASQFGRRLVIAALAVSVLVAGAIIWAQRAVDDRIDRVKTVTVPDWALGDGTIGKEPVTILVVGTDPRRYEGDQSERTDTIVLVRLAGDGVTALWLPRDLQVDTGKLVDASARGPAFLVDTIRLELGAVVDHYVEVDFNAFERIVDEVGGVSLFFPGPVRDVFSGFAADGPACQTLDGQDALAWVRSRHVELFEGGEWTDALSTRADLDRQRHQQEFVRALSQRVRERIGDDPAAAVRLADVLVPALVVDAGFENDEIRRLVGALVQQEPTNLRLSTLPWKVVGTELQIAQPAADDALAPFRGDRPAPAATATPTPPATTPVHPC